MELVAVEQVAPWLALGPAVALTGGLKLAVGAPAAVRSVQAKLARFMRS